MAVSAANIFAPSECFSGTKLTTASAKLARLVHAAKADGTRQSIRQSSRFVSGPAVATASSTYADSLFARTMCGPTGEQRIAFTFAPDSDDVIACADSCAATLKNKRMPPIVALYTPKARLKLPMTNTPIPASHNNKVALAET